MKKITPSKAFTKKMLNQARELSMASILYMSILTYMIITLYDAAIEEALNYLKNPFLNL